MGVTVQGPRRIEIDGGDDIDRVHGAVEVCLFEILSAGKKRKKRTESMPLYTPISACDLRTQAYAEARLRILKGVSMKERHRPGAHLAFTKGADLYICLVVKVVGP
jgi:hypothetical protein